MIDAKESKEQECVKVSPDDYMDKTDEIEDMKLLVLAQERMVHYDPNTLISQSEVDEEFGWTEKELEGWEEIEFEY